MLITDIEIQNFRNYKLQKIEFNKNINVFYGDNAQGKTNILEAIFISAFGKSYRTSQDKELIKKGENFSNVIVNYKNQNRTGSIKIQIAERKTILLNGIKLKKLSELLGNINVVLFTPDDIGILKNGPAQRRKFLDMMIGQIKPNYVYNLNTYLKILEQRNTYLKQIQSNNYDEELFKVWDEKLAEHGTIVSQYRKQYIEKISNQINKIHKKITDGKEDIEIKYFTDSESKEELIKALAERRKLDIIKGYTTKGVQKDDFMIYINGEPVNIYGSQGQHRTAILSLKLCELNIIFEETGEKPILLLDDFMSELDEKRIKLFLDNIDQTQVIITCTKEIKIEKTGESLFYVNSGNVEKQNLMKEV